MMNCEMFRGRYWPCCFGACGEKGKEVEECHCALLYMYVSSADNEQTKRLVKTERSRILSLTHSDDALAYAAEYWQA